MVFASGAERDGCAVGRGVAALDSRFALATFGLARGVTMRKHFKRKNNGPLGVRIPVWLFAFGVPLVCILTRIHPHSDPSVAKAEVAEVRTEIRRFHSFAKRRDAARTEVVFSQEDSTEVQASQFDFAGVQELIEDRRTWQEKPTRRAMH
jgi:hypothetical protein